MRLILVLLAILSVGNNYAQQNNVNCLSDYVLFDSVANPIPSETNPLLTVSSNDYKILKNKYGKKWIKVTRQKLLKNKFYRGYDLFEVESFPVMFLENDSIDQIQFHDMQIDPIKGVLSGISKRTKRFDVERIGFNRVNSMTSLPDELKKISTTRHVDIVECPSLSIPSDLLSMPKISWDLTQSEVAWIELKRIREIRKLLGPESIIYGQDYFIKPDLNYHLPNTANLETVMPFERFGTLNFDRNGAYLFNAYEIYGKKENQSYLYAGKSGLSIYEISSGLRLAEIQIEGTIQECTFGDLSNIVYFATDSSVFSWNWSSSKDIDTLADEVLGINFHRSPNILTETDMGYQILNIESGKIKAMAKKSDIGTPDGFHLSNSGSSFAAIYLDQDSIKLFQFAEYADQLHKIIQTEAMKINISTVENHYGYNKDQDRNDSLELNSRSVNDFSQDSFGRYVIEIQEDYDLFERKTNVNKNDPFEIKGSIDIVLSLDKDSVAWKRYSASFGNEPFLYNRSANYNVDALIEHYYSAYDFNDFRNSLFSQYDSLPFQYKFISDSLDISKQCCISDRNNQLMFSTLFEFVTLGPFESGKKRYYTRLIPDIGAKNGSISQNLDWIGMQLKNGFEVRSSINPESIVSKFEMMSPDMPYDISFDSERQLLYVVKTSHYKSDEFTEVLSITGSSALGQTQFFQDYFELEYVNTSHIDYFDVRASATLTDNHDYFSRSGAYFDLDVIEYTSVASIGEFTAFLDSDTLAVYKDTSRSNNSIGKENMIKVASFTISDFFDVDYIVYDYIFPTLAWVNDSVIACAVNEIGEHHGYDNHSRTDGHAIIVINIHSGKIFKTTYPDYIADIEVADGVLYSITESGIMCEVPLDRNVGILSEGDWQEDFEDYPYPNIDPPIHPGESLEFFSRTKVNDIKDFVVLPDKKAILLNQNRDLFYFDLLLDTLARQINNDKVLRICSVDSSRLLILYENGLFDFVDFMDSSNTVHGMLIDKELIWFTDDGYYYGSREKVKSFGFRKNNKGFGYEQFDLKFNRPDIILTRMGNKDAQLIEAYHKAYLKRLKKMSFTEDMFNDDFHIPEITITNYAEISPINEHGTLHLELNMKDSKYKLDRINIWVNDVAIYGVEGISLRNKKTNQYMTSIDINLAKGKNKVQVAVLNESGVESHKSTLNISCKAGKTKPDLYLITIGESEFQQSSFNLTYAAKDAIDMVSLFKKSKAHKNVYSKTLTNEEVNKENIAALQSFIEKAGINDEVMIFIAGHGVLDANLNYYFATYNMDFQNPKGEGLAYEELESLLDGIPSLKKTLLIDACHSGEIDKEEIELASSNIEETGNIQFRAVGNSVSPKLGIKNTSELTKSLFTDLRKGTGATVISSAGGMEFAMEGEKWRNGLFTYCLINGVQTKAADYNGDGEVWLSEIQRYVTEQVSSLSDNKQQPSSRIENQEIDYRIW